MGGALRFNPQSGGVTWSNPVTAPVVERIELTQMHLETKGVFLKNLPVYPYMVTLVPDGGIPQVNGIDFQIQGNFLTWQSLGLDNFLDESEVLTISYSA